MLTLVTILVFAVSASVNAQNLLVVDISQVSLAERIAILSCQGLLNRNSLDSTYTIKDGWDDVWLELGLGMVPGKMVNLTTEEYLMTVCEQEKFGKLIYSKTEHHEVIPQIITLAGVLDAVPLDIDSGMDQIWMDHEVVFDARVEFLGFTEVEATALPELEGWTSSWSSGHPNASLVLP